MRPLAVALVALWTPAAVLAHEVSHEVVRGRAVAVHAWYAGGEPLAYAEYQVFSPTDPKIPWQKGRTDRDGWLAFVPAAAGTWRIQVADATGHGTTIEVAAGPSADGAGREPAHGTTGRMLRTAAAAAVIGLVFLGLAAVLRRRPAGR